MKPNTGSFDYYIDMGKADPFFRHLTNAMMHADKDNTNKLKRIFPHMMDSRAMSRWDVAPASMKRFTINVSKGKSYPEIDVNKKPISSSYAWRLMMGGDFYKNILLSIHFADDKNREKLSKEFPNEAKAYNHSNWYEPPED